MHRGQRRAARYRFDPVVHREALVPLLHEIAALADPPRRGPLPQATLDRALRRHPKGGRGFFSRSELIAGYRAFARAEGLALDEQAFLELIRMRPVRTQSGVTPITVLSRPFPCPGKCVFCPNDARMPKSYLSDEPGCQRAESYGFDPYLQTHGRLTALRAIGHATDKVELIVLGGTWSFYPEPYQLWFVTRCFEAMNDFGRGIDGSGAAAATHFSLDGLPRVAAAGQGGVGYNRTVERVLRARYGRDMVSAAERGDWASLRAAHGRNETSGCRCVGLSLETRPDHVDLAEVVRLRALGCTKVQLGYQSLDDRVLAENKRGHDVASTRAAMSLLRGMGFKVHAHWMPNLLGADPRADIADFQRIFDDPALRPDELKVYPCSLVEGAELMESYRAGTYRPYTHGELLEVLVAAIAGTPRYCRLSRVIRDICAGDIVAGNRTSNFRELAERALDERGVRRRDIRSREVGRRAVDPTAVVPRITRYGTATGIEVFLERVDGDDRIAGFCRLSLPTLAAPVEELAGAAIVRELHVYGAALSLGAREPGAQHRGLGSDLLAQAKRVARDAGFDRLAVISAVGTRAYYRERGFVDGELYQHCRLDPAG